MNPSRFARPGATAACRWWALPWLLIALGLSGCTLLPGDRETLQIFDLHAGAVPAGAAEAVAWQLAVEAPSAREPVAGVRMAVIEGDGGYSVVSGARWSLPAPRLVQSVLVEAFERSGRIEGVGPAEALRGDCRLGGELRTFHWQPRMGEVGVALAARLQCGATDAVVAMRTFEATGNVTGSGAAAIAAAFDAALAELTPTVVDWVLRSGVPGG